MVSQIDYQAVAAVTVVLSFVSILGAFMVMIKSRHRKRQDKRNQFFLVNDYVFFMSFFDLITHFITFGYWTTLLFKSHAISNISQAGCFTLGMIFQFSLISSATWSFAIAVNLFRLINGAAVEDLKSATVTIICRQPIKRVHICIYMWSGLFTLIPAVANKYGLTKNIEDTKYGFPPYECWISGSQRWQLCLYGPVLIYVMITTIILCRNRNVCTSRSNSLQKMLFWVSVLFSIIWLFPLVNRIWDLLSFPEFILIPALHHVLLACIGLGNFIIWIWIHPQHSQNDEALVLLMDGPDSPLNNDCENDQFQNL